MSQGVLRWSGKTVAIASAFVVAACSADRSPTGPSLNPVGTPSVSQGGKVLNPQDTVKRYIVRLKSSVGAVSATATALVQPYGGKLSHVFEHVFSGFVVEGISPAVSAIIARNPLVEIRRGGRLFLSDGRSTLGLWQSVGIGLDRPTHTAR